MTASQPGRPAERALDALPIIVDSTHYFTDVVDALADMLRRARSYAPGQRADDPVAHLEDVLQYVENITNKVAAWMDISHRARY